MQRLPPATVLAGTALLFALLWVLSLVWTAPDEAVARWVADHIDATEQARWRAASWPGSTWTGLALGAAGTIACLVARAGRQAAVVAAATATSLFAIKGLKLLIGRDRPEGAVLDTHAFPSGHTATATVAWGLLALVVMPALARRWALGPLPARFFGGLWVGLAVMAGVCRILGGLHWMSDVLAGWAFGGAVLAAARFGARPASRPNLETPAT